MNLARMPPDFQAVLQIAQVQAIFRYPTALLQLQRLLNTTPIVTMAAKKSF
jgi:hypothetical protein